MSSLPASIDAHSCACAGGRDSRSSPQQRSFFGCMAWSLPAPASRRFRAHSAASNRFCSGSGRPSTFWTKATSRCLSELVQRIVEQRHPGGSHTNLFFRLGAGALAGKPGHTQTSEPSTSGWTGGLSTRKFRLLPPRPRHARRAHLYSGWTSGRAGTEGRRGHPSSAARAGLLGARRWHQQHGEFIRHGYFAGRELSSAPPCCILSLPHCACIPPPIPCYGIFRRESSGRWCSWTNAGATGSRRESQTSAAPPPPALLNWFRTAIPLSRGGHLIQSSFSR